MKNGNSIIVNAIYAVGRNGEMGNADGSLPWGTIDSNGNQIIREDLSHEVIEEVKSDMENFKRLTTGNIVIMGYNTYRTFISPLPNRVNIVIDRTYDTDSTADDDKNSISNNDTVSLSNMNNASTTLNNGTATNNAISQSGGWLFASTLESAITLAEKIAGKSQSKKNDNSQAKESNLAGDSETVQKEIFIIGGAKILDEAFGKKLITGKIYKTVINADFPEATVRFSEN